VTLDGTARAGSVRSREHWTVLTLALLAPLGLALIGAVLKPDPRGYGTHEQLGFQPCLPMRLWNIPCPGCGVTTAVTLAVRGHLLASLRTQPFGLVTLLGCLAFAAWALAGHFRRRDLWRELQRWNGRLVWTALLVPASLAWAYKIALVRGWLG